MATIRAALYLRVSTDEQTVANQADQLRAVALARGWAISESQVFSDVGISGAKGRDKRPGLDACLTAGSKRQYDVLMCWSVDRMGRSLGDLVDSLRCIDGAGVQLYLHQQQIDTSTPGGRALFQMAGVFAEFERSMIVARIRAGLERRKRQGKSLGRPTLGMEKDMVARVANQRKRDLAVEALKHGGSIQGAIRASGLGSSTVQIIAREVRGGVRVGNGSASGERPWPTIDADTHEPVGAAASETSAPDKKACFLPMAKGPTNINPGPASEKGVQI